MGQQHLAAGAEQEWERHWVGQELVVEDQSLGISYNEGLVP